jgi:hypothetical protein
VKDDGSEVLGRPDPPLLEHGLGDGAEPRDRELPGPLEDLRPAHVADLARAAHRVIHRVEREPVGIRVVLPVLQGEIENGAVLIGHHVSGRPGG